MSTMCLYKVRLSFLGSEGQKKGQKHMHLPSVHLSRLKDNILDMHLLKFSESFAS